jgi:ferredoxin
MKVTVDTATCQGHARCRAICPELFELDELEQKSHVKLATVPPELEGRAERAVNECPESALSLDP